ncbi:MAG: FtsX-like permease family protein [Mucilaginibacter sp.]|nr:FtsX-like permease family protein [Mucilaginibacter sp.]
MIKNYIKIAWRNLIRQRLFSLINISGLAIGLAVCMLIMLYVAHEHSYDRFHKNANRIFALNDRLKMGGQEINMEYTSFVSGPLIKQGEPHVADYVRTRKVFRPVIVENAAIKNARFSEEKMFYADANFFNVFSFKLLSGSRSTVLNRPFSVVISQDIAKKYFGTQDAVGKMLKIKTDSTYSYLVTGVVENMPSNSSIDFNFLASNSSLNSMPEAKPFLASQIIQGGAFRTYLILKQAKDSAQVQRTIQSLMKGKGEDKESLQLIALTDIHLNSNFGDTSNTKYLKIFPFVAGLILLLALVNYMSLSTARFTLRAKEVGVRKVSGASRKSLAMQFYVESALFICLSFVLGYILCYSLKSSFLDILQLKIDTSFLYNGTVMLSLSGLFILTLLVAGSYPSIVLSAFKPVITLKGKMSKQAGGVIVRKVFTTLQFTISVGLIICGIIIDRQLYYFRHTDTGVNRENVLMVPISNSFGKQYQSFKSDVMSLAGVSQVATSHYPMYKGYDMFFMTNKGESIGIPVLSVDQSFISTLNIKWKIPPVSLDIITVSKKVVINEAAISKLKLPANPIGRFVDFGGKQKYEIQGVVKDFNFSSLESAVAPLCMFVAPNTTADWGTDGGCLFAKIKPHANLPSLIESIHDTYKKYNTETPFSYTFMDDAFNEQYKAEDRLASIFSLFTGITILLAGMGLFGLAAFTIEQRTKEIGVRKILGASLSAIATLLSKDFLKLVLLAILIGSPIAWWAMNNWLQNFAYRIHVQWWMFASAGLLAIIIAVITVSYHALKAAIANPVNSLRSE